MLTLMLMVIWAKFNSDFYIFFERFCTYMASLNPAHLILWTLSFYCVTVIFSFFFLNFSGLYGVFALCVFPAVVFWVSLCINMQFFLLKNGVFYVDLFKWFKLNGLLEIQFELIIDVISFSFMFLTTTIAIFVNIFTFSYFRYEPNVERLLLLLNAFVLSMLFLVISGNLVLLFFGWEMIGLTSFLLINFWSTRVGTLKSAFKAYTFNKVSDVSFFFAVLLVYYSFNELSFVKLDYLVFLYNDYTISAIYDIRAIELISFFF